MFYSSGTTGRPRACASRSRWNPHGRCPGTSRPFATCYGFDSDTVWLSTGPLYHAGPLYGCLAAHRAGGTIVVMERFDAEQALRAIDVIE